MKKYLPIATHGNDVELSEPWKGCNMDDAVYLASDVHDLLVESLRVIKQAPMWEFGKHKGFEHIQYCRHCSYSLSHGHGEGCIVVRLERATSAEQAGCSAPAVPETSRLGSDR